MSARTTFRALPTMLRVGVAEAIAYRAEMLIWILSTSMPLIMMAMWTAVAREAEAVGQLVGGFTGQDFVRYFLAIFLVRQCTGAWAAWQLNYEVRQGTLSMRLLRPVSPLWAYVMEHMGFIPLRLVVIVPVAVLNVVLTGPQALPGTLAGWVLLLLAIVGAWLINFLVNVAIGTLSFFMESSLKVMDVWLALFFVFSGYLYPVALFPPWLKAVVDWLPFRYQIGFPAELMTGMPMPAPVWEMLARQWLWVGLLGAAALGLWRLGLKRYAAFGG